VWATPPRSTRPSAQRATAFMTDIFGESELVKMVGHSRFHCPSLITEFLSPKGSRQRHSDPIISASVIHLNNPTEH
jgi:hypothetical protein